LAVVADAVVAGRQRPAHVLGVVGRRVVADDELEVGVVLGEHRLDHVGHPVTGIAHRKSHRHQHGHQFN
jgi:hypothetical protein